MPANFTSRFLVLDRNRRFFDLTERINRIAKGQEAILEVADARVAVVAMVVNEGQRFVEAVVHVLRVDRGVILLNVAADDYRSGRHLKNRPFQLNDNLDLFRKLSAGTGIPLDDLIDRVTAGYGPLHQAIVEFRDVTKVFQETYEHRSVDAV